MHHLFFGLLINSLDLSLLLHKLLPSLCLEPLNRIQYKESDVNDDHEANAHQSHVLDGFRAVDRVPAVIQLCQKERSSIEKAFSAQFNHFLLLRVIMVSIAYQVDQAGKGEHSVDKSLQSWEVEEEYSRDYEYCPSVEED